MPHHYPIEPAEVLGVGPGASLQEIREAYRTGAMKHHPDHGGDAWAFRLVAWAYETLSTKRVIRRASEEFAPPPPPGPRPSPRPSPRSEEPGDGRVRKGVEDRASDPADVVEVEVFLIRMALESPLDLFAVARGDRNLSCCLNVSWPARGLDPGSIAAPASERVGGWIDAAFAATAASTRAADHGAHLEDGRFTGWLSYPTAVLADEAFQALHAALKARGLAVKQWTREVIIPREVH